jgi:hypothetical protein
MTKSVKKHPVRFNQNVAQVPVPICDPCFEGWHSACEGGNCACVWTHDFDDKEGS